MINLLGDDLKKTPEGQKILDKWTRLTMLYGVASISDAIIRGALNGLKQEVDAVILQGKLVDENGTVVKTLNEQEKGKLRKLYEDFELKTGFKAVGAAEKGFSGMTKATKALLDEMPVATANKFWDEVYSSTLWRDHLKNAENQVDLVNAWKLVNDELADAGDLIRKNPDALKQIDDAIQEGLDGTDAVQNAVQTLGKSQPTWPEIQALFKRGNDFNRKVRSQVPNPYQYYEVTVEKTLSNGSVKRYRLDSYNPGSDIVSRKATDFDNIQTSTFQNYISELKSKYQTGLKIVKPGTPINGQTLQGAYKLEVPKSNLSSSKLTDFQQIASDNGVEIIFIDEF